MTSFYTLVDEKCHTFISFSEKTENDVNTS